MAGFADRLHLVILTVYALEAATASSWSTRADISP